MHMGMVFTLQFRRVSDCRIRIRIVSQTFALVFNRLLTSTVTLEQFP